MKRIAVVFWSGTGNTEEMAKAVIHGAEAAGGRVTKFAAADFGPERMDEFDAIAFGCPAMGSESLEDEEFAPMFASVKDKLSGKPTAIFGSFGWGDGEWMRNWQAECKAAGALLVGEPVICSEAPDDEALAACKALGAALA